MLFNSQSIILRLHCCFDDLEIWHWWIRVPHLTIVTWFVPQKKRANIKVKKLLNIKECFKCKNIFYWIRKRCLCGWGWERVFMLSLATTTTLTNAETGRGAVICSATVTLHFKLCCAALCASFCTIQQPCFTVVLLNNKMFISRVFFYPLIGLKMKNMYDMRVVVFCTALFNFNSRLFLCSTSMLITSHVVIQPSVDF